MATKSAAAALLYHKPPIDTYLDNHHREAMVESEPVVATSFPRFPDLPAELRHLVWHFALPRRVFEIRSETISIRRDGEANVSEELDHDPWRSRGSDLVAVILAPPPLLSVNREARRFAQRTGSWKFVGSHPRGVCRVFKQMTWFDPSADTLCFDDSVFQHIRGYVTEQNGLVMEHVNNPAVTRFYFGSSPASPVCVSLAALSGTLGKFLVEQWKRKRGFWSGVPRYLFYHDNILMHLGRSARVRALFGEGVDRCYTLLVNARDREKLRQLRELYVEESDPTYFQRRTADWLEGIVDADEKYVENSYNDLRDVWIKAQDDVPSSSLLVSPDHRVQVRSLIDPGAVLHAVQQFDQNHSWCREIVKAMPRMELVVHFRLCITNHDNEYRKKKLKLLGKEDPSVIKTNSDTERP
ncbi:uncharacterized protein F4812DRAFT_455472 [Daldinia caldariorum]|uniref:uncharacterized protein n=1 Tax=Daldinia caldariorum TaxID=326644 RepID=UPI002007FEE2|nr:uncharacterized protein F4812DRAFT_455472 [Daldinia caldariorum]KAI1471362.1 hypothetical protein F4812DRAFT_455472 [Daldinia caldariorum]